MKRDKLSSRQVDQYQLDGYLILKGFLNPDEVEKLYQVSVEDTAINKHAFNVDDSSGKRSKLSLWYKPGDDVFGLLTRSQTMVEIVDQVLEGDAPVCHFHSKLMQKEPEVGGAWEWHQDYGYWYKNEFLFPDQMMSVMVAVTEANKSNGCLQVIKGSHKMGRVEHGFSGEQVGASQRFVDLALQNLELEYVELEAGDILLFHSNILHSSSANLSDRPRWSLISVYNRASNVGYSDSAPSPTSSVTPINVVPNEALLTWETANLKVESSDFLKKDDDVALK